MVDPALDSFSDYLDWISASWNLFEKPKKKQSPPQPPGKILQARLDKLGLSQSELARRLKSTHAKVNEVINGKRGISVEFAMDLERVLSYPATYWLSIQASHDLWIAKNK